MAIHIPSGERLLTTAQVAEILSVHRGTIRRWETEGRLTALRTKGGSRRFLESAVANALLIEDSRKRQRLNGRATPGGSGERFMTAGQVARTFDVSLVTIRRWDAQGRLTAERTAGGHRRYLETSVLAALHEYTPRLARSREKQFRPSH